MIKFYSFLLTNLKNIDIINYVYSHQSLNEFLSYDFDFKEPDIIFYFVNFAKSISLKFDNFPFEIFYNKRNIAFPLFSKVIKFYNHNDNLV